MFIYCFDEENKNKLIKKGLKFIKQDNIGDKKAYIFLCNNKSNYEDLNKKDFIITNKMNY